VIRRNQNLSMAMRRQAVPRDFGFAGALVARRVGYGHGGGTVARAGRNRGWGCGGNSPLLREREGDQGIAAGRAPVAAPACHDRDILATVFSEVSDRRGLPVRVDRSGP